jgi:hypothetical protein
MKGLIAMVGRNDGKAPISSFRFSLGTLVIGPVCLGVFTALDPHVMVVILLTLAMLVAVPASLTIDLLLAANRTNLPNLQFSLRQMFLAVACVAAYISMLKNPWPFRLRFAVSRPALELLAAKVERGETLEHSQRAGLFLIQKAGRKERGGHVYTILWTEPGGGSPTGFVHPAPEDWGLFNDWSTARLNVAGWQYFIQD